MKTIIVALLLVISYFSLNVAKDSYLANQLEEQRTVNPIKTQNFPVVLGKAGDTIYGTISGDAKIKMMASPTGPKLASASYDLVLNLSIQKQFIDQLVFKPIIEGFLSSKNASESLLKLRLSANRLGVPPSIKKIQ